MASFEEIFRIPPSHVLKTKFHSHGGDRTERWIHVEYDDGGQFVARYVSRGPAMYRGDLTRAGWKKFDIDGRVVAAGELS